MKQRLSKLQKDILTTLYNSPEYKMRRATLIFSINDWQEYNKYTKECGHAKLRTGYWKRTPDGYNKKQASFTRSLQTLASNDLIYLLHMFGYLTEVYGKGFASKMGTKARTLDEHRKEGMDLDIERYEKEKKENLDIGTFDEWFKKPFRNIVGEFTSRAKLYIEDYARLDFRNAKHIVLTQKGTEKASELLKVK